MKKITAAVCGLLVLLTLAACGREEANMAAYIEKQTGITLPEGAETEYEDSHGGFHGDGVLYAKVTADGAALASAVESAGWRTDMPGDMRRWFAGGEVKADGETFYTDGYFADMGLGMPNVDGRPYFYRDRFSEENGGQCPFAPYTQNFTLAVYDPDTEAVYFVEGDS